MTSSNESNTPTPSPPSPSGEVAGRVWLKPRKARPFFNFHPWVLDTAIARVEGSPAQGAVVSLYSDRGEFIARGIINPQSRLRIRLYEWSEERQLDRSFWRERLEKAVQLRRQLSYDDPRQGARLVFSESDGMSGLVIDRYGEWLVAQVTSAAFAQRIEDLVPDLVKLLNPRGILLQTEHHQAKLEGISPREGILWGEAPSGPVVIEEHGVRYGFDLLEGQKTGFYLDQRENRRTAATYFRGRKVLDLYCHAGGFGLTASLLGGAVEALGIDSSSDAISLAKANAKLNDVNNVQFHVGDALKEVIRLKNSGTTYGGIVLDPPKFARRRDEVPKALQLYGRINLAALELLEPGGILVTCSCSGHVTREDFLQMLGEVAQASRRPIQVLEQRSAAPDHPISVSCPETEYLKCFICRAT